MNQLFTCWDFTPYNFAKSAERMFASLRRALKRSPLESIFINGKFRGDCVFGNKQVVQIYKTIFPFAGFERRGLNVVTQC
ncbi:hypothetical protein D3C84_789440 [compost metagenome]